MRILIYLTYLRSIIYLFEDVVMSKSIFFFAKDKLLSYFYLKKTESLANKKYDKKC